MFFSALSLTNEHKYSLSYIRVLDTKFWELLWIYWKKIQNRRQGMAQFMFSIEIFFRFTQIFSFNYINFCLNTISNFFTFVSLIKWEIIVWWTVKWHFHKINTWVKLLKFDMHNGKCDMHNGKFDMHIGNLRWPRN